MIVFINILYALQRISLCNHIVFHVCQNGWIILFNCLADRLDCLSSYDCGLSPGHFLNTVFLEVYLFSVLFFLNAGFFCSLLYMLDFPLPSRAYNLIQVSEWDTGGFLGFLVQDDPPLLFYQEKIVSLIKDDYFGGKDKRGYFSPPGPLRLSCFIRALVFSCFLLFFPVSKDHYSLSPRSATFPTSAPSGPVRF